jgi:hypothetical protein
MLDPLLGSPTDAANGRRSRVTAAEARRTHGRLDQPVDAEGVVAEASEGNNARAAVALRNPRREET